MGPRKRVLVDCDGVLANFVKLALGWISEKTGKELKEEELDMWDLFSKHGDLIEKDFWGYIHETPGVVLGIEPYQAALEGIPKLLEVADVYVVTAPHSSRHWAYERGEWLYKHFGFRQNKVIQTHAKYVCKGDILVDDKESHIIEWMDHHPDGLGIVWAQPYNAETDYFRTGDWKDVIYYAKHNGPRVSCLRTARTADHRRGRGV